MNRLILAVLVFFAAAGAQAFEGSCQITRMSNKSAEVIKVFNFFLPHRVGFTAPVTLPEGDFVLDVYNQFMPRMNADYPMGLLKMKLNRVTTDPAGAKTTTTLVEGQITPAGRTTGRYLIEGSTDGQSLNYNCWVRY